MNKKLLAVLLAIAMVFTLASCGPKDNNDATTAAPEDNTTAAGDAAETTTAAPADDSQGSEDAQAGYYTYNAAWTAAPQNWNPHTWEMSNESAFMDYTTTPLVTATFREDGGWEWMYDAAESVTDITADFADKEFFGIPADATERYVYQVKIKENLKWQNGDAITANDYVESMKYMLDPEMKNYRSNSYTSGESEVRNAALYFANDKAGQPIYKDVKDGEGNIDPASEGKKQYLNLYEACYFTGDPAVNYKDHEKYGAFFKLGEGTIFDKYTEDMGYVEVTDEVIADLKEITVLWSNPEENYVEWLVYDTEEVYPETPWEKVGLVKVDDYTFNYILERPLEEFYMHSALTSDWLVHIPTYEANMETINNLKQSKYCSTIESSMSYGPYKVVSFENDKQIVLERNPEWYGYKDGKFDGQYRADKVVINIVEDLSTQEQLFMQGKIDKLSLTAEKMIKYKKSDKLTLTDETYTLRMIFATSMDSLKARDDEKGSGCRKMLHYKDFRKALSLSIDRAKFCQEATSGFRPAFFLFNKLYYYDISNDPDSVYRDSKYAKASILDLYEVEYTDDTIDAEYDKITGIDLSEAKELFQAAYDQAVADGVYTDGDIVPIEIMVGPSELLPEDIKQQELLNEFFNAGAAGTPFEGMIKVEYESGDKRRYDNVAIGKNMAIRGAWGGAAFYPFSTVRVYTNPEYMGGLEKIHESNGWNPSTDTLKMSIVKEDGSIFEDERTFEAWSNSINGNGDFVDVASERLQVLSKLEAGVLQTYQCIPVGTYTAADLISYKIDYPVDEYHIMYGFGGFRFLEFNYDDAEWAEFVNGQNGELNYE